MSSIEAIYIALEDPHDVGSWSGTTHFMARALEGAGFHLSYIGPLKNRYKLWNRIQGKVVRMCGWDYSSVNPQKGYARQVERQLPGLPGRVILSCGKPQLTHLRTELPVIFFDDASVPAITSLYPGHMNYSRSNKLKLLAAERLALEKCRYACYMSDWAADAALATYGREFESKIKVIPIGANMETTPAAGEIEQAIQTRERGKCNLLFVGVEWERKGGAIAVAVAGELQKRGVSVRLDMVGCVPPVPVPDFVRVHGFVSKRSAEGSLLMARLYRESHFFLLPTQAEAYGVVFVEALAHGLPSLGCRVGGVPTIVQDGVSGWLFPPDAPASLYAGRIQSLLQSPEAYAGLCRSAFQVAQTRLSWKRFGESVRELVDQVLD
jgi:glycosyltransferase involved in cell wall biosynthesis